MSFSKKITVLVFALFVVCVLFSGRGIAADKPIVLKFSDVNSKESAAGVFCETFAKLTEEKTQGRVKIETYYGGTLTGNDIEGTQTGIADFSQHDVSEVTDLCKFLSI